jgi:hypothetical protein
MYSPILVVFGVLSLVLHKNWSSSESTPYYWSTILQHSNIFGVPVHHSQNVGVHVVNLWSAFRLTLSLPPSLCSFSDVFTVSSLQPLPPVRPQFDLQIFLKPGTTPPFGGLYNLSESEQ